MKLAPSHQRNHCRLVLFLIWVAAGWVSNHGSASPTLSHSFNRGGGQNTYFDGMAVDSMTSQSLFNTGLDSASWVHSIQGLTPNDGSEFLALANANANIDFLGVGLAKELGDSIAAQQYAVSFFVTTYNSALQGVPFSEFTELRLGGVGGTMQWDSTPTPFQEAVWVQWSGTYTPSPSDVGQPFLFRASWNERAMTSIAIDGNMTALPVPEPATWILLLAGGATVFCLRRKRYC